jgi:hypothetical protein
LIPQTFVTDAQDFVIKGNETLWFIHKQTIKKRKERIMKGKKKQKNQKKKKQKEKTRTMVK